MTETKTFFENWAETQNELFDNWMQQTKEMQKGTIDVTDLEKGGDAYLEWLEKQRELFHSLTHPNGSKNENPVLETANDMWDNYFNTWKEWQKKSIGTWTETGKRWTDAIKKNTDTSSYYEKAREYQNTWLNGYKTMMGNMKFPTELNFGDFSGKTAAETFAGMQKGMDSYLRFYELWSPVFKAMQNGVYSAEEYKKILNPELYREMMDKMFGFDLINPMKDSFNKMAAFWSNNFSGLNGKGNEVFQKWAAETQNADSLFLHGNKFFFNTQNDMYKQFQDAVSPFFKLVPPSKEKEQAELTGELYKNYMASANVLSQLQYQIYTAGKKALDALSEDLAGKAKEGKAYTSVTEFYNNWINTSGKVFEELFATDEYSRLQGELVNIDAQIKQASGKIMESMLAPYPVALRSQLDELYKTNYELRNRLYQLEKEVAAFKTPVTEEEVVEGHAGEIKNTKSNSRKKA